MEQKLKVNSVVIIRVPLGTSRPGKETPTRDMRCYVIDYNKSQRSYNVLPIRPPYRYSKVTPVREKAIVEVVQVISTSPNFTDWVMQDAVAFFSHEFNLISKSMLTSKNISERGYQWDCYVDAFRMLEGSTDVSRLLTFLAQRKFLLGSRNLPLVKEGKSRSVMRRLRKKGAMRNTNSNRSKNKQKTTYLTPVDIAKDYTTSVPGVSTRIKKKKKSKQKKSPKPMTPDELYAAMKKARAEKNTSNPMLSFSQVALSPPSSKKKRKKKLDMPF